MRHLAFLSLYIGLHMAAPQAFASAEQDYARSLSRARSPAEVQRATQGFEALKVTRSACRLQLREGLAPIACYESLALENQRGLHPTARERAELLDQLDKLCATAAAALKIPHAPLGSLPISGKCRKLMSEAREIRKYRERRPDWSGN